MSVITRKQLQKNVIENNNYWYLQWICNHKRRIRLDLKDYLDEIKHKVIRCPTCGSKLIDIDGKMFCTNGHGLCEIEVKKEKEK